MPKGTDLEAGRKVQFNRVLTSKCVKLIARLAAIKGINDASLIEIIVREEAHRQGLKD